MPSIVQLRRICLAALAFGLWGVADTGVARAENFVFTENFNTMAYCDTLATTAWWDTTSGTLRFYPVEHVVLDSLALPGSAYGFWVHGEYLCVAAGEAGLSVVRAEDPSDLELLPTLEVPGSARAVQVDGNYGYVAASDGGLAVVDFFDPWALELMSSFDTPGWALDVSVEGDVAFVADSTGGVVAFDVRLPDAAVALDTLALAGEPRSLFPSGDVLSAVGAGGYLVLIDVSELDAGTGGDMQVLSEATFPGTGWDIVTDGALAFIAAGEGGLVAYDLSDPAAPQMLSAVDPGSAVTSVDVDGDIVLAGCEDGSTVLFDVTDPSAPQVIDLLALEGAALAVSVHGAVAFEGSRGGMVRSLSLAELAGPEVQQVGETTLQCNPRAMALQGDYAYVTSNNALVLVVDVSDPGQPVVRGRVGEGEEAGGLVVRGGFAYVAAGWSGLVVVDVTDPDSPQIAGSISFDVSVVAVDVAGNYAYLACGSDGFRVVDVSDPQAPQLAASIWMPGYLQDVLVQGNVAYVCSEWEGVHVVEIDDPSAPQHIAGVSLPAGAYHFDIAGDYAYVTSGEDGLRVVDIMDTYNPLDMGNIVLPSYSIGRVYLDGDYAYVCLDGGGVTVVDVTNPLEPSISAQLPTEYTPEDVGVAGGFAFVPCSWGQFQVFQCKNYSVDAAGNRGVSTNVYGGSHPLAAVRFGYVPEGQAATWFFSCDGGNEWISAGADLWYPFWPAGPSLKWRCDLLTVSGPGFVDSLCVEALAAPGLISSIEDVSGDQGGWVHLRFGRSGYDMAESGGLVVGYQVYRLLGEEGLSGASPAGEAHVLPVGGNRIHERDGRFIVEGGRDGFPPGEWEIVATVYATQQEHYTVAVPTLCDSTAAGPCWTTYLVTTHTTDPLTWYVSDPDSGYSVDNIVPGTPPHLRWAADGVLAWNACLDEDFGYYGVYGSSTESLEDADLLGYTIETTMDVSASDYAYYLVCSFDCHDNRSEPAVIGSWASDAPVPAVPQRLQLRITDTVSGSGSVRMLLGLPVKSRVRLSVFDVGGRSVWRWSADDMDAGWHEVQWDGSAGSEAVAGSGIYYVRLEACGRSLDQKIVLVR